MNLSSRIGEKGKMIGTLVPISALFGSQQPKEDRGTFAAGLVFLDWLQKTRQSAWQLLPLHETQLEFGSSVKHVPSPYKSYGIGLSPRYLPTSFNSTAPTEQEKDAFIQKNRDWIHDYALFCALRDYFKTDDWRIWETGLRNRIPHVIEQWSEKLKPEIDKHIITQWQLYQAYGSIRKKAKKLDITLVGDLPFYPSVQSPLVWAHQDVFQLEKDGSMRYVSGIPDTPGIHFGRQVWGHPLYKWGSKEVQRKHVLAFWKMRLRYLATLFDLIRLDHLKAFFAYGAMDSEQKENDRYKKGPGAVVFTELVGICHEIGLSIFAEDSGYHAKTLQKYLKVFNIAGIKIFRFGVKKDGTVNKPYASMAEYPQNCVAYTTTHDTETLVGYLKILTSEQKKDLASVAKVMYRANDKEFAKAIRDAILRSPAHVVIIPIQDWLLTTERINIPGTEVPVNDPNWQFRLKVPIEELTIPG